MTFNNDILSTATFSSVKMYSSGTSKQVLDLTGFDCELECRNQKYPINKKIVLNRPAREISFEMSNSEINRDIWVELGIDKTKIPDEYTVQWVEMVQARRHRKKRINKKWLKRYGYKQVVGKGHGLKLKIYTDGTFAFVK